MNKNTKVIFEIDDSQIELYRYYGNTYRLEGEGLYFYISLNNGMPYIMDGDFISTFIIRQSNYIVEAGNNNRIFQITICEKNNLYLVLLFRQHRDKLYLLLDGMDLIYKDVDYSIFNKYPRSFGYDEYCIIDEIFSKEKNDTTVYNSYKGKILNEPKSEFVLISELGVLVKQHIKEKLQKIGPKVKINEIETKRYSSFIFEGSPVYIENGKVYFKSELTHRIGGWAEDCFNDLYANYLKKVARKLYKRLKSNEKAKKVVKSVLSGKKITYWLYAHHDAKDTFILRQDGKMMLHLNESSLKEE